MAVGNIEMLKQERDLFVAFSQLFLRHDSKWPVALRCVLPSPASAF